jgi:hypothetical protein
MLRADDAGWRPQAMNDATTLRPLGVPLDEIESRFRAADLEVSRDGDTLVLTPLGGERLQTRVAVMAPDAADAQANAVTAVIRIFTALPSAYARRYDAEMISFANRFASLGAFTVSEGFSFVGSRLTIHEGSPDWDWQLPLAVTAAAASVDAVTGGMERFLKKAQPQAGSSSWTEPDLDAVEAELAKTCACTRNRSGLAAEFSLKSAAPAGKPGAGAAYWELLTQPPHSELGGGLLCILQLSHRLGDAQKRHAALNLLNVSEMNSPGLPPHLGAWCEGKGGDNFAYVSFLPNLLHDVPGLATRASHWARSRAEAVVNLLELAKAG